MIKTDAGLESTRRALFHMESAMAALYKDKAKIHPDRYALMAEPYLTEIRNLRQEIDDYIGVTDATAAVSEFERKMGGIPNAEDFLSLHPAAERVQ
jgi:hypothetical protein